MSAPKDEPVAVQEGTKAVMKKKMGRRAIILTPKQPFLPENHFYTKVLNAQIHPLVSFFLVLDNERIAKRFCHLYPSVNPAKLHEILTYKPEYFRWGGSDLFHVTSEKGYRQMVIIETNSCPSGQKSMPLTQDHEESGGYRTLIEHTFKAMVEEAKAAGTLPEGALAVVYDKNAMEASGYAYVMASVFKEKVYLVEWHADDTSPPARWTPEGVLQVLDPQGEWVNIRATFRYITQKPWSSIPVSGVKTVVLNPVVVCLAGGRNKLIAAKAYEFFNAEHLGDNFAIRTPKTVRDVRKEEIPLWVASFGGKAVIKVPYSNAGQGVYTITSPEELQSFMDHEPEEAYDQYIIQSLIGNYTWSSASREGQFFHVGTVPDKNNDIYCADVRMMVHYDSTLGGFRPLAIYSRRARSPLSEEPPASDSWDMLGTNLSEKSLEGGWTTDSSRLLIMDRRDFNRLGVGIDDLIDAYIQTVMSIIAIDELTKNLMGKDKLFNSTLFSSLNKDDALLEEIKLLP